MATAQPLEAPVGAERRSALAVTLTALGWTVLDLFAALEIFPFVFTVANSFKCLPAVQTYPRSLIPCRHSAQSAPIRTENGRVSRPPSETSGSVTFNPTLEGYRESSTPTCRAGCSTRPSSPAVTVLRLAFDLLAVCAGTPEIPRQPPALFTILGTMMVPSIVLLIPRFIILKQFSMLNTYQGLIVPLAVDAWHLPDEEFFESLPVRSKKRRWWMGRAVLCCSRG